MAWLRHRVWLAGIACACAASGLTACSSGATFAVCDPRSQRTWAIEVTSAGHVRWQTPLPLQQLLLGEGTAPPLVAGSVAIFSQDDVLYALRLSDGRRVWSWSDDWAVQDVFRRQGLVVVYAAGSHAGLLTGLDAATGKVRWTRQIGQAPSVDVAATADGGLAMSVPDLEVVNLSDGRVRWARPDGVPAVPASTVQPTMAVSGASVLVAGNDHLTSYDDRTGRVRWTDELTALLSATLTGLAASPGAPGLQTAAGLVYLTDALQQPHASGPGTTVLIGISAATGQFKWRFTATSAASVKVLGSGLVSIESADGVTWLDELSPVTGRLRWRKPIDPFSTDQTIFAGGELIAVTSTASTSTDGSQRSWAAPQGLLTAIRSADGHRVWQVTLPTVVSFPLTRVPGGLLVYAAAVIHPC